MFLELILLLKVPIDVDQGPLLSHMPYLIHRWVSKPLSDALKLKALRVCATLNDDSLVLRDFLDYLPGATAAIGIGEKQLGRVCSCMVEHS